MKLESLRLAVEYHKELKSLFPNNPEAVLDTACKFMAFLNSDEVNLDNSRSEPKKKSSKP